MLLFLKRIVYNIVDIICLPQKPLEQDKESLKVLWKLINIKSQGEIDEYEKKKKE